MEASLTGHSKMTRMKKLLKCIPHETIATLIIIVLVGVVAFYYHYLTCTCSTQTFRCTEAMGVPVFIIFFLMLLTDRTFRRTAKHAGTLPGVVVKRVIRAFLIALLWVVAVLVHGDWYFCCKIDEKNIKLPCKPEMNEAEKAKRAEMMNSSKVSGYTLLLAIVVAAFLTLWSGWRRFFEKKLGIYGRKSLYYQVVLEEEEKILEDLLRKAVNENLIREITKNINKQDWDGCLNAAQEMINKAKLQQTTATKDDNTGMSEGNVKGGEQAQQGPARHQAQNLELQSLKEDNKETTPLFD